MGSLSSQIKGAALKCIYEACNDSNPKVMEMAEWAINSSFHFNNIYKQYH